MGYAQSTRPNGKLHSRQKPRKGHQSLNQAFKRDVREVLYHNESYLTP